MKKILCILLVILFCGSASAQEEQPVPSDEMRGEIMQLTQKIEDLEKSNSLLSSALAEQNKILKILGSRLITGEKREKNIEQSIKTAMGKMDDLEQGNLTIRQSSKAQNQQLQTLESGIKKEVGLLQENDAILSNKVVSLKNLSENNLKEIQNNVTSVRGIHDDLTLFQKNTTENFQDMGNRSESSFSTVARRIHNWTYYSVMVVAMLMLMTLGLFIVLRRKFNSYIEIFNKSINETKDTMRAEALSLDTKLAELLEASLGGEGKTGSNALAHKEIDHTLPLKVGEEIHRMRKRISHMPEDTTGLGALKNSLIRLEDEFNAHGYEMVDLLGVRFVDGLTTDARFVPADDLNSGEEVITKVIKPQINYKGVLIKPAQVEVGVGGDNNGKDKD